METEEKDEYFQAYDDLEVHRLMLCDSPRTQSYKDALLKNGHYFKDKMVMDVGAGSGILSLFAWKAGAKKVFAVEASGMAELLVKVVQENKAQDVIEVCHSKVEDLDLKDVKVDVIISEWMGFYLLHESMLDSVLIARDKFLKEDGLMMPSHASIQAAPCSLKNLRNETIDFWSNVYGFNMKPLAQETLKRTKPEIMVIGSDQVLADPVQVLELDLKYTERSELNSVVSRHFLSIKKISKFQGLALWFTTSFLNYEDDKWTDVILNTDPCSDPTHWKQTIVPLFKLDDTEEDVEEDDIIGWELSLIRTDDKCRNYAIKVELLDPAEDEHPVPCGCQSAKCTLISALLEKEMMEAEELP